MDVEAVIKDLGGTSEVARACAVGLSAVSNWKTRNSIPPEYWASLVKLAASHGISEITFESLGMMHAKPESAEARA